MTIGSPTAHGADPLKGLMLAGDEPPPVNCLVDIGLLREITGYARNRSFRFDQYLRLFEEPAEVR